MGVSLIYTPLEMLAVVSRLREEGRVVSHEYAKELKMSQNAFAKYMNRENYEAVREVYQSGIHDTKYYKPGPKKASGRV